MPEKRKRSKMDAVVPVRLDLMMLEQTLRLKEGVLEARKKERNTGKTDV